MVKGVLGMTTVTLARANHMFYVAMCVFNLHDIKSPLSFILIKESQFVSPFSSFRVGESDRPLKEKELCLLQGLSIHPTLTWSEF